MTTGALSQTSNLPRSILLIAVGISAIIAINSVAAQPRETTIDEEAQAALDQGALQAELNEFEAAETAYLAGIELLVEENGEFSPQLIDPYLQLASLYIEHAQPVEALTVLEHARHISQRNFGLFNEDQTLIIDQISQAYQVAGDTRSAQEIQEEVLSIAGRRFGEDSLEIVPFHYRLAEYYDLSRMRARARRNYIDALDVIETELGDEAPERLKPLRELVRIDILTGETSSALRRLEAALEFGSGISPAERALSLAALGDYSMATRRVEAGITRYRAAYAVLAADDATAAAEMFANPELIDFIPPASPVDRTTRDSSYEWGEITVDFKISANGLATLAEVVAATPPGLMDARYQRRLLESYYRPRFVAGEPATTESVRFTHRFRYFTPLVE
ncbi:MAG: hypothetical protein ACJ0SL_04875 [Candidatus Rariloculaceae bacterium]